MDISFIIPAYNAEAVIERSVSSIVKNKIPAEVEVIVVDDGSKDNTAAVCRKMAESDSAISVFTIQNSGQGLARNYGLSRATGDYICFVDADDEVIMENIYKMWIKAKENHIDVIMGSYVRKMGSQTEYPHLPQTEGFFEKDLYHKIKTESVFGYVWNKLYEKEFLSKHDLVMDDIRKVYMEDLLFNMKVWSHKPKTYYMGIPVYAYYVDQVSTTRNYDEKIHEKNVIMIENMTNYLEEKAVLEENLDMVIPIVMRMYCWSLVKNVPYEGNSIKRIRTRSLVFSRNEAVRKCIRQRGAIRQLFYLPSKLQSIFYAFCCLGLRWKCDALLALVFFITYPLLKTYISGAVK